jgi:6-phosphogluconolactonase
MDGHADGKERSAMYIYIGSYEEPSSNGIHLFQYDEIEGELQLVSGVSGIRNPSFLILNAAGSCLYAVSETDASELGVGGKVAAFDVDPGTGELRLLNERSTKGGAPCHLVLSPDERLLVVANYMGGNTAVFPIAVDGSIDELSDLLVHEGNGVRADRQEAPHPHSANVDPSGAYVVVPDLGIDRLAVYRIDHAAGRLTRETDVVVRDGAGPRHLAFHPSLPFVYVVNELESTVTVFAVEEAPFRLHPVQTVSTLPAEFAGNNTCADIHITPDGAWLYASNRGHDSLAAYRIDTSTGMLTASGTYSSDGRTPRNFAIAPDGRFVIVANQDSDSIAIFRVESESGALSKVQRVEGIRRPVCVAFA